jgi:hypothetical protein
VGPRTVQDAVVKRKILNTLCSETPSIYANREECILKCVFPNTKVYPIVPD